MLHFKASKFAILATACLLGIGAARSAHAQADTVTNLGGLASWGNVARAINDAGQVVGYGTSEYGTVGNTGFGSFATEWSGGSVIDLGGLPGSLGRNAAYGINNAGKVGPPQSESLATVTPRRWKRQVRNQPRRLARKQR